MTAMSVEPAAIAQPTPQDLALSGCWTARGIGAIEERLATLHLASTAEVVADGAGIEALDTAGAWLLQRLLLRLRGEGVVVTVRGLRAEFAGLLESVARQVTDQANRPVPGAGQSPGALERVGLRAAAGFAESVALLSFVGESVLVLASSFARPSRLRWRSILYNIRSAGFDALPIVGLLSFLLGVVVAYQGAEQPQQSDHDQV